MLFKKIVAIVLSLSMLVSTQVFAIRAQAVTVDPQTSVHIPYNDFESYDVGYELSTADGFGYGTPNNEIAVDKANVVMVKGNKCIEASATTTSRTEIKFAMDETASDASSFVLGFSIYLKAVNTASIFGLQLNGKSYTLFYLSESEKVKLGSTETELKLSLNTWHDVILELNTSQNKITANIDGKVYAGELTPATSSSNELYFKIFRKDGYETVICIDNLYSYLSDKALTPGYTGRHFDFEDFDSDNPPSGFEEIQSANINVTKEPDGFGGNCLKLESIKNYPGIKLTLDDDGIEGKSVLEFDYKYSAATLRKFSINVVKSDGTSGSVSELFLIDSGKLKAKDTSSKTKSYDRPEEDVWYHHVITFDTDSGNWSLKATAPGKSTISHSGSFETAELDVTKIKGLQLGTGSATNKSYTDYIDNVILKADNVALAPVDETIVSREIRKTENKIRINYNGGFASNVTDYAFKINGTEATPEIYGSQVILTIPAPVRSGGFYYVEASAVDLSGNSVYSVNTIRVLKDVEIRNFAYNDEASEGTVGADASVVSNSDEVTSAVLITAVYDKSSGVLLAVDSSDTTLTIGVAGSLSTSVTIPDGYDKDKIISASFIWKSASGDITPLCKPLPMK